MADLKISALTASTTPLAGTEVLPIVQSSTTKQVSVANLTAGRAVSALTLALTSSGPVSQFNTGNTSSVRQQYINTGGTFQVGLDSSGGGIFGVPYAAVVWHGANYPVVVGVNNAEVGRFTSTGFSPVNGAGIDFSATSGTGTSELLSDYEEGTWTPTLTPSTSGTITLGSPNACAYTKIGRVVTVNGLIDTASVSAPVGTTVTFNNLPFASNGTGTQRSAGAAIGFALSSGTVIGASTIVSSTTSFSVFINASLFQTGSQVYFQLSYVV